MRLLLKRVQHQYPIRKARKVDDTKRARRLPDTYLANACTNRLHRLPVSRIIPLLDLAQLIARLRSSILWKVAEAGQAVPEKRDHFHARSVSKPIHRDKRNEHMLQVTCE